MAWQHIVQSWMCRVSEPGKTLEAFGPFGTFSFELVRGMTHGGFVVVHPGCFVSRAESDGGGGGCGGIGGGGGCGGLLRSVVCVCLL